MLEITALQLKKLILKYALQNITITYKEIKHNYFLNVTQIFRRHRKYEISLKIFNLSPLTYD